MIKGQNLVEKGAAALAAGALAFMVGTAAGMMVRDAVDPWDPTAPLVASVART